MPLCVGFGAAAAIAAQEMAAEAQRLVGLRDRFLKVLAERLGSVHVNGDLVQRIPGNLNLCFAGIDGEALMRGLEDLAVSSGSACTSAALEPSYVLRALGLDAEHAHGSLRIGFGRFTTEAEMDYAAARIGDTVGKLRRTGGKVERDRPVVIERLASGS
jgi:cysteine desulfurase